MGEERLGRNDLDQLAAQGVTPEEVERQLELFRDPPGYATLTRACSVGDGIVRLASERHRELLDLHADAAARGRFSKFVPASGAASRMFKDLLHYLRGSGRHDLWSEVVEAGRAGQGPAATLVTFVQELERFPFRDDIEQESARRGTGCAQIAAAGEFRPLLAAFLDTDGMSYAQLPKGLLKFHAAAGRGLTPFEEHLAEGAAHVRDGSGIVRLHFTVSPEHREGFRSMLETVGPALERDLHCVFDLHYSEQKPSTDTLAVDLDDRPFRDGEGRLVFRPGGHGALIENLAESGGDLVYVKNIDNVQPEWRRSETLLWKRLLGGYLVELHRRVGALLDRLDRGDSADSTVDEGFELLRGSLGLEPAAGQIAGSAAARRDFVVERLERPLRICGVVPNTGEPGGGPFWVTDGSGSRSLQIVEPAQIDSASPAQQEILHRSTHFNPVDLVCALRDRTGRPFDLSRFVDPRTAMISRKSAEGRELKALERPGLWNGAMAGWNTVFVEVPLATFSPVKTVLDLLRDEHQPPG